MTIAPSPSAASAMAPLRTCCPGKTTGASGSSSPRSLSNATRLPQKVTEPMRPEATVATVVWADGSVALTSTAPATRAEAPPPKAFSSATISGIAVIAMRRASVAPMAPPRATPARIMASPWGPAPKTCRSRSVATTASSIPAAPIRLPRTAVRGCVRPRMPRMKRAEAAR